MQSKIFRAGIPARYTRIALTLALLGALNAQAQEQASPDNGEAKKTTEMTTIVVTGTHKAGLSPTESISPIDVYGGAQIENQGAIDLTDSLTKITPSLNTQRFPIADGTSFVRPVSLRDLSPDQTLVLVDGVRRHRSALVNLQLAPLGTVNQGAQAVDFSAIPANAIKRVEVLRDGSSVLYGSDAIAGVVNIILDDSPQGATVSSQYGEYSKGDGGRFRLDADAGFALGQAGFLHVSAEHETSDITSRGVARPDAAAIAAVVGNDKVPYNGFGQRWGDPDVDANKLFINAGFHVSDTTELYGFGSYMKNETLSGFFYRAPVLPAQYGIAGRATLIVDANGDFLPDAAPQALVNGIIAQGLNPANYLTADGNSPSGFVLLNPIYKKFPGGYGPLFGADINDYEVVGGVRGEFNSDWKWDLHGRNAGNELDYRLENSINPSLGDLSPTSFHPGKLTQEEREVGADFVNTLAFASNPLTLAYGALWRDEIYTVHAGDLGSTAVGPTASVFGVGSDGFQGFFPASAGKFKQDSYSGYVDAETSLTDKLSGAAAMRYEHAQRFGSSTVFKLSGRYAFTDTFAARVTYNTGFRTPTPGQEFTLNVTTTADQAGNLIPSGTYPVSDPVALALGATPLRTEKSKNFTGGLVWDPLENVTTTLDFYKIRIDHRIGLVSKTVSQANVDTLIAQNYPNAQLLLNSAASYFANAFGSDVKGIDFVVDSRHELGSGILNIDFRYNYNKQKVVDIVPGTINGDRVYDLEHQIPNSRGVLSFDYALGKFDGVARVNYYGGWKTTGGLFGNGDASDAVSYGGKALLDLEARYKLNKRWSFAVGGDNVLNTYPGKEQNATLAFLGNKYAITSPFGIDGAFWYVRAKADF